MVVGSTVCAKVASRKDEETPGGEPYRPAVAVDVILHIYAHCAGALIQDGKLWLVIEEAGHLHNTTDTRVTMAALALTNQQVALQQRCLVLTAILCFSPPLRTSIQSWIESQLPSLSRM